MGGVKGPRNPDSQVNWGSSEQRQAWLWLPSFLLGDFPQVSLGKRERPSLVCLWVLLLLLLFYL